MSKIDKSVFEGEAMIVLRLGDDEMKSV